MRSSGAQLTLLSMRATDAFSSAAAMAPQATRSRSSIRNPGTDSGRTASARSGWPEPNVARGCWQKDEATASTFRARIHGEGQALWLRTGDLGFLDADGELYVTGRIKDVIIIRGMNYYPQDVENSMQNAHSSLRRHCGAAFTISDENDDERLILVQEIERSSRHAISVNDIVGCIRETVFNEHEIAVHKVVLIRPGSLPKTTSGKVQRGLARKLWQQGQLDVVTWEPDPPSIAVETSAAT
jgi:acyl-CoA synthetase (AMP-forming)/AMP-acid ligase II